MTRRPRQSLLSVLSVLPLALAGGCATPATPPASAVQSTSVEVPSSANAARVAAILGQNDRRNQDRALDNARQAKDTLAYLDVSPGMDVAVLAPGAGYFTELLARSIGIDGRLFARNPPSLTDASLARAWDDRLTRPAGARVVRLDDELGRPLTVHDLDLVFLDHEYASLRARGVDPSALDASVWNALKQDGRFVVVEREVDDAATQQAIERHGFRLASEGRFLRPGTTPSDWRDGGTALDKRVLLTFTKP